MIPLFFGSRQFILKMYSILEDLYSFELKYQTIKLDVLENCLAQMNKDVFAVQETVANRQM